MIIRPRRDLYSDPFPASRRLLAGASPLARLFVNGEQGAWLDINDLSLLYTTSAGTTHVAAVNDPIGRAERRAGTVNALNATSSQRPLLKQFPNADRYYAYHDRVDDKLTLASMPSGTYTVGFASFSGVQIYEIILASTGPLDLPGVDFTEVVVVNRSITAAERDALSAYLATKAPTIGPTDLLRIYCASNSVNLSIVESGNSGSTWELGDGQTASGTSCVKTIVAPKSVILRATDPQQITDISIPTKSLFGQLFPNTVGLTRLTSVNIQYNQFTGPVPSFPNSPLLGNFQAHSNLFTGNIPSVAANPLLYNLYLSGNALTGSMPDFSTNPALINLQLQANRLSGTIKSLIHNTVAIDVRLNNNQFSGVADDFGVPASLGNFSANTNLLPAAAVNAILAAFVAANRASGTRVLDLGGTGNDAPTGQGVTDKATLVSRGWTVTTN